MKKKIIIIILMLITFCLTGCGVITNNNLISNYIYSNSDKYSVGASTFNIDQINNIDIDWISDNVIINQNDSIDKIKIYENVDAEIEDDYKMHYFLNQNTLYIKTAASMKPFNHNYKNKTLYVEVPENIEFNEIIVDTVSANITLDDISSKSLEIDTTSGMTVLTNLSITNKTAINTISGIVDIDTIICNDIVIDSISGSIDIIDISFEKMELDSISGSIDVKILNEPSFMGIDTVSGSIEITIDESLGFTLEFCTISGKNRTSLPCQTDDDGDTYYYGNKKLCIEAETISGSFLIKK